MQGSVIARCFAVVSIVVVLTIGLAAISQASATVCATDTITARGEPSRFAWLAKTKTRANWRRKVRLSTGLGAAYANWARAEDTEERCLIGPRNTLCIFTGRPCRP